MALRYCVGIDLGTSNSALACADLHARDPGAAVSIFEVPQLVGPGDVGPRPLLPSHLYLPGPHELPEGARSYLEFVSDFVGVPLALVGVGAGRDQVIWARREAPVAG